VAPEQRTAMRRLVLAISVTGVLVAALIVPVALSAGLMAKGVADRFLGLRCDVAITSPPRPSTLLARDGKTVIARIFTQNRTPVQLADVPMDLVHALVATEDRRFYHHHGVDLRGLFRAGLHDLAGGSTQGGSTLTMQYVKQVRYFEANTAAERAAAVATDIDRKLENAKCALQLERRFSKQQILQRYLDIAFFGENSYGVATAAKTYFGVPVSKLTLPQSALLVGLLQAPSQYDPFLHPRFARERRDEVIGNLVDTGYLDRQQAAKYEAEPIRLATKQPPPVAEGCAHANPAVPNAGFFCDYVLNWLHQHGIEQHTLDVGGLRVVTSLNADLQARGQRAVWRAGLRGKSDYILVMPSVDPTTGAVTTMISSRRYGIGGQQHGDTTEPLFTAAFAGAGSTYKYFTAAAAMTAGATPALQLTTSNNTYRTKHCAAGPYTIHNAGDYPDTMELNDALPQSSNTYFVALEDQFFGCKLGPVVNTAVRLGMHRLTEPRNDTAAASIAHEVITSQEPTFTLGQEPTSSLELTGAFSAAANDGVYCPPIPVMHVTKPGGSAVDVGRHTCHRVLSRYVARSLVTLMRKDTHDGTAAGYFGNWYANGGSDVAGKTGTDNNAADNGNSALWFVGLTPHLVSAASLVNPENPKQTVHDLPGMPGSWVGQDIFGAYASTYWLDAYGPALHQDWTWPSPQDVPNGKPVPNVIGSGRSSAVDQLRSAGFHVTVFPVPCGSDRPEGDVAYQQPPVAAARATVTICLSSGIPLYVYVPPPPAPTPPPKPAPKPKPKPKPGGGGGGGGGGHGHGP
jgi:membrane peptidoglycan carboxypeptidase